MITKSKTLHLSFKTALHFKYSASNAATTIFLILYFNFCCFLSAFSFLISIIIIICNNNYNNVKNIIKAYRVERGFIN